MKYNYEDFFKTIQIDENENESAKFYLNYRGFNEHEMIRDYIKSFGIKPTYRMIASIFRYDKRIRRILIKYIGFIEEYMRACILNNYNIEDLNFHHIKEGLSLYEHINSLEMSNLINLLFSINKNLDNTFLKNKLKITLRKNYNALRELRNAICHNRILCIYNNFKECDIVGVKSFTLKDNIINLKQFLPLESMKESLVNDINEASLEGDIKYENQVKWDLPKEFIITLK